MIDIKFTSIGYTQFDRKGIRSAMGKAARLLAKQLKSSIGRRSGDGVTYIRGGQAYTASSPGRPPARYTGRLFGSVKGRASRRGYAFVVSAIAPHAHLLEIGTRDMAARQYFAPQFAAQVDAVQDLMRGAVTQGITVTNGAPGNAPAAVEIN